MSRITLAYRAATLAAYFALLALLLNWFTWLAPPERMPIAFALILTSVPLLFPLRGLLHGRLYTHAWTSFLALPYFILGVDAVAAGTEPIWLGWVAIVTSTVLFIATVGYTRYRGRELRTAGQ